MTLTKVGAPEYDPDYEYCVMCVTIVLTERTPEGEACMVCGYLVKEKDGY